MKRAPINSIPTTFLLHYKQFLIKHRASSPSISSLFSPPSSLITMSTCGNCDCADKSQCVKKGNSFGIDIIETEKSYFDEVMDVPAAENGCKCGAGSACKCVNCSCGAH